VKFSGVQLTPVLLPERTGAPPLLRERPRGGAFQARGECASAIRARWGGERREDGRCRTHCCAQFPAVLRWAI